MSTTEDGHPVEAFTTNGADKTLGEGIGSGCLDRRAGFIKDGRGGSTAAEGRNTDGGGSTAPNRCSFAIGKTLLMDTASGEDCL